MRNSNIVKLDSKGRVLIPIHVRKFLNVDDGTELIIVEDNDKQQVRVLPLIKEKTAELRFNLADLPGALAHIADTLANYKMNIIMSESRTLVKGKMAEWDVIIDTSECNGSLEQFKKEIIGSGKVKDVEVLRK
jgi:bifunctional DNA-binding transcriptional regulator/antitoxin component of YhaV-PrlF toxin-antitoxin module